MIDPIDAELAQMLDSFTVPDLDPGFADRVVALAAAQPPAASVTPAALPRLRNRHSRIFRIAVGGASAIAAGLLSISAAAMGYLGEPINHAIHQIPVVGRVIERVIPEHRHHHLFEREHEERHAIREPGRAPLGGHPGERVPVPVLSAKTAASLIAPHPARLAPPQAPPVVRPGMLPPHFRQAEMANRATFRQSGEFRKHRSAPEQTALRHHQWHPEIAPRGGVRERTQSLHPVLAAPEHVREPESVVAPPLPAAPRLETDGLNAPNRGMAVDRSTVTPNERRWRRQKWQQNRMRQQNWNGGDGRNAWLQDRTDGRPNWQAPHDGMRPWQRRNLDHRQDNQGFRGQRRPGRNGPMQPGTGREAKPWNHARGPRLRRRG